MSDPTTQAVAKARTAIINESGGYWHPDNDMVRRILSAIHPEDHNARGDLLLELVHKMQRQACEYLQGNQGTKDFVSDLIYMLDGPEQRAAEAAHTAPDTPAHSSPKG